MLKQHSSAVVTAAGMILGLLAIVPISSQSTTTAHYASARGLLDRGVGTPVAAMSPGTKDAAAIAVLTACAGTYAPPSGKSLEATGVIAIGSGTSPRNMDIHFYEEAPDMLRWDATGQGFSSSIRYVKDTGGISYNGATSINLPHSALGAEPVLCSQVLALANGSDVAVVDDGIIALPEGKFRRITISHFSGGTKQDARPRTTEAVSFYFDPDTSALRKSSSLLIRSGAERLANVKVVAYSEYQASESLQFPHQITVSVGGQQVQEFSFTTVSVAERHESSFYKF